MLDAVLDFQQEHEVVQALVYHLQVKKKASSLFNVLDFW
jgi:hypothetical protein